MLTTTNVRPKPETTTNTKDANVKTKNHHNWKKGRQPSRFVRNYMISTY